MVRALPTLLAAVLAIASVGAFTTVSSEPAAAQAKKEKPLKGTVRYKRVGGYSYKYQDTKMSPSEARRFTDPGAYKQSVSGPFDSGFFFDSAITKNGGDAPYMQ